MTDHPSPDGLPEQPPPSDAPLAGPASRVFRYLPDGDPKDRAERYLGDPDPQERAQRYLTESQIRRLGPDARPGGEAPSEPQAAEPEPQAPEPEPAPAAGGEGQSALHTMVSAVLEERRAPTPVPQAFIAPAPATPVPATVAEPAEPPAPAPVEPQPASEPAGATSSREQLARLRELSDHLRTGAVSPDALQPAVDLIAAAVGADAVVLSLSVPRREQVTSGTTLGGGPRHAVAIRAEGSNVGELMACRLTEREPFGDVDELFLSLAADQLGTLVGRAAAGSALNAGDQQFVNTLVSEMRAPLGSVARMLEDFAAGNSGPLSEQQQGYLAVAAGETAHLLAIVRDIQTLSRLRRPEPHEMEHIGIGPLLARAAARAAQVAAPRGIDVSIEEPAGALVVKGVPEQLDRALSAVLDNAVKFSHDGGRVTVSAELRDGTVRVTVADDGIGMDPADTAEVFERFGRARTALEAGIAGVGLGLTIVKEVVEVHGGRAWAESAAGHGTRLHVALPGAA